LCVRRYNIINNTITRTREITIGTIKSEQPRRRNLQKHESQKCAETDEERRDAGVLSTSLYSWRHNAIERLPGARKVYRYMCEYICIWFIYKWRNIYGEMESAREQLYTTADSRSAAESVYCCYIVSSDRFDDDSDGRRTNVYQSNGIHSTRV